MRNILLKTTFKDDLTLLKPFYAFYKDIWNPETYIFYIGYNKATAADLIQQIEDRLQITLVYASVGSEAEPSIRNTRIYTHANLWFVLYETEANPSAALWDFFMRPFLYKEMTGIPRPEGYRHYLNVDNDDFFYVKDVDAALSKPVLQAHALEFLSQEKFDLGQPMQFISSSYYYRVKGALQQELRIDRDNAHNWCRSLFLSSPYKNETHVGISESCAPFRTIRDIPFEELDNVCFAFGCIDLEYLLNAKYWLQSAREDTTRANYSRETIVQNFNDYYIVTDTERAKNLILTCDWLKKYFQDEV